jgi:DNA-binding CsgD family transcriptional regulator
MPSWAVSTRWIVLAVSDDLPAPRTDAPLDPMVPQPATSRITVRAGRAVSAARPWGLPRFIDDPLLPFGCLGEIEALLRAGGNTSIGVFSRKRVVRMRADRRDALLDFLLMAVADDGTTPFATDILAGLRKVVRCEVVSYREWSPQELLELSLAADDPESILPVWRAYPQVRQDDPLAGGTSHGSPLPNREWLGRALAISDFISDREFHRRGLYAEVCKPLGVRAVMKVFLPTGGATGASFVFDTIRRRFTETDCLTLQRIVPHLGQLRRNAQARRTYPALIDSTAAARIRLLRLTPRERVVLARAAAGETNTVIAQALFVSPGTIRKHLEHIYDKLEVRTRTEAAAIYTQERVVTDSTGLDPSGARRHSQNRPQGG